MRQNTDTSRFDTVADVNNIGYVVHPTYQNKVFLSKDESKAKSEYLVSWRGRLNSLKQSAVYDDTGDECEIPTGKFCSSYPDDKTVYKPKYAMRYEEYLAARAAETAQPEVQ